jgi:hypothetical protein
MSELENMTVREAVGVLRERVEHNRFVEETARREREQDEAALAALEPMLSGTAAPTHESDGQPPAEPQLRGLAAVREVMRAKPKYAWSPREVHDILETKGWVSDKATRPVEGTASAINRLLAKKEIVKVARGRYLWRGEAEREALTES